MQHERNNTYVNYFDLAVQIDPKTRLSRFIYEGHGIIADNISVRFENSEGKTIACLLYTSLHAYAFTCKYLYARTPYRYRHHAFSYIHI